MGDDGVLAVYHGGVIPAFVEHTHVDAQNIGKVNGAVHGAFIRAYDHQVLLVHGKIRFRPQKSLHELIRGIKIVKPVEGDGILDPWVVGVKGDDVADTHIHQFLQRQGAVQRLPLGPFVLSALIQEGHDHIQPVGLAVGGGDDPFKILIMIVRGHMVHMSVNGVGKAVVAHIHHEKQVFSADRLI